MAVIILPVRQDLPGLLRDAAFLAAHMRDEYFVSSGSIHDVWRVADLKAASSYIFRVRRNTRQLNLFKDDPHSFRAEILPTPQLQARTALPVIAFYSGAGEQIADVQPEMKGQLLGLSRREKAQRIIRSEEGLVSGAKTFAYHANPAGIAATNAKLWAQAERIADLPVSFFMHTIKDALEIEEQGYEIDTSNPENYMLTDDNRIGFLDLELKADAARVTPSELAGIIFQPAHQIRSALSTPQEQARCQALMTRIEDKMIQACERIGISYSGGPAGQVLLSRDIVAPEAEKRMVVPGPANARVLAHI